MQVAGIWRREEIPLLTAEYEKPSAQKWYLGWVFKNIVEKKGWYCRQPWEKEMIKDVELKNGKVSSFSKIPKNETNKNLWIENLVNRYVFINAWESLHIPKKLVTRLTPGGTLGT